MDDGDHGDRLGVRDPPLSTTRTPDAAARTIVRAVQPLPPDSVPLREAGHLVLADDVRSPIDLPHWDNSAMDGFAARAADLESLPATLDVIEEVAAGAFPARPLGPGQCARVFTGAPIPEGADTVIRQEDTEPAGEAAIRIVDGRDVGRNIRKRAEDIQRGATVITRGTPLRAAHLGLLASMGYREVLVHPPPRVAILASGDEIVDLDQREEVLAGRKIASSNTYTLSQVIADTGARPIHLGIARDDPDDVRAKIEQARGTDLLVTTAGVSVGEHDYLRGVLADLGLHQSFWRIRMRPGAPVGFGLIGALDDLPWIGLPGNPVSTMVTHELFVRPALRVLMGHDTPFRRTQDVIAGEPIELPPPLCHFLRVTLADEGSGLPTARLTGAQGSGILTSMARADALMIVREDQNRVVEGDRLRAIVLDDPVHTADCPW